MLPFGRSGSICVGQPHPRAELPGSGRHRGRTPSTYGGPFARLSSRRRTARGRSIDPNVRLHGTRRRSLGSAYPRPTAAGQAPTVSGLADMGSTSCETHQSLEFSRSGLYTRSIRAGLRHLEFGHGQGGTRCQGCLSLGHAPFARIALCGHDRLSRHKGLDSNTWEGLLD